MSKSVEKSKTSLRPRRQQANISEETILTAAEALFQRFGFAKVTMDEIAEEAGMGKASLYYYFPTKEQLFAAVVGRQQKEFVRDIESIIDGHGSATEKLNRYVGQRFLYFNTMLNFRLMELDPALKRKPIMADIFTKFRREELALLRRIFRQGRESGEFKHERIDSVAELFLHIFHGLRLRYLHIVPRPIADESKAIGALHEEVTMAVSIFLRGISGDQRRVH